MLSTIPVKRSTPTSPNFEAFLVLYSLYRKITN